MVTPCAGIMSLPGACPHDCPDRCAWVVTVENGRAVRMPELEDASIRSVNMVQLGRALTADGLSLWGGGGDFHDTQVEVERVDANSP